MQKLVVAILILLATSSPAQDVDSFIELLRSDIETGKMEYITDVMQFNEDESTVFWPVHREYQFELDKLGDAYLATIKDYAASYDSLSDETATDLIKRALDIKKDRLDLQMDYFKKFSKLLSPIRAARWLQLENQIGLLLELQVVSAIPFAESTIGQ